MSAFGMATVAGDLNNILLRGFLAVVAAIQFSIRHPAITHFVSAFLIIFRHFFLPCSKFQCTGFSVSANS